MGKIRSREHILYGEDRRKFIDSCLTHKEKLVCHFLLKSGFRNSEFIHMKKKWIDFNNGFIKIPFSQECRCFECKKERWKYKRDDEGNIIENKSKLIKKSGVWMVKTKNAERHFPIPKNMRLFLESYFKNHDSIMEILGNRKISYRIVQRVGKRAGLYVTPHSLRATRTQMFVEKGVHPTIIRDLMGHGSVTVADSYTKSDIEGIKKVDVDTI